MSDFIKVPATTDERIESLEDRIRDLEDKFTAQDRMIKRLMKALEVKTSVIRVVQ
jgi:uncharacterized coiled-coil protein SlyX